MKNIGKKVIGAGVATLLVTSVASLNAGAVQVTDYKSYAEAQYIVAGGPLVGDLVDALTDFVEGAGVGDCTTAPGAGGVSAAADSSATPPVEVSETYTCGPLDFLDGVLVPLGDVLGSQSVGAVGAYAKANQGASTAASGAVTNSGLVQVGGADTPPANAALSLTGPDSPLNGLNGIANATLNLGAAGSSVAYDAANPAAGVTRGFDVAGGSLEINVGDTLMGPLNTILAPVIELGDNPLVGGVVGGVPELLDAVTTITGEGLEIDLQSGDITLDVNDLVKLVTGYGLSELPQHGDVLQNLGYDVTVTDGVAHNIPLVPILVDAVVQQLGQIVGNLGGNLEAGLQNLTVLGIPLGDLALTPIVGAIVTPVLEAAGDAIGQLGTTLSTALIQPLFENLEPLLDVRVNVWESDPGSYQSLVNRGQYSVTAVRVVLGDVGASPLLHLNLGNSLVGPNSFNTYDDQTNANTTNANADADTTNANVNANANVNLNANGGAADKAVDTLPSTGASNLWPFWLLGLLLVALGAAAMVNEKRRESALLA